MPALPAFLADPQINGLLRLAITGTGVWLTNRGIGDAATYETIAGGVLAAAPYLWSWYQNRPAGIASSAQKIEGVNLHATAAATPAVAQAIADTKAAGYLSR